MIIRHCRTLLYAARFHLRPARRWVDRLRLDDAPRTWGVRLGPVEVCGLHVFLRSPRFADAATWRELRLREQEHLERWWATSELSWEQRHTEAAWVASVLHARAEAKAGRALPLVVEIDGKFAGQFNLDRIEPHSRTAELGIWLDPAAMEHTPVTGVIAAILIDYAVFDLGIRRLTAPIADGNRPAAWGLQRFGFVHEGLMKDFLDVGGVRTDHHLWAFTADQMPPGGLVKAVLDVAARQRPYRRRTIGNGHVPHPAIPTPRSRELHGSDGVDAVGTAQQAGTQ